MSGRSVKAAEEYPPTTSVKLNGPPGTGKTTQLLERVTGLLDDGYGLSDITFITYRKQMAEEFLRRLHEKGYTSEEEVEEPWEHDTRHFGTIHGVCNRITASADVAEDEHRREFLWENYRVMYDGNGGNGVAQTDVRDDVGELVFDAYGYCIQNKKRTLREAPQYMDIKQNWPSHPSFEEFREAWTNYKRQGGYDEDCNRLQDFSDMLHTVDEEGLTAPGDVLVVDEYHDFTPIMHSIAEGWMEGKDTVIVGGDPLQAIYGYLGATPSFFTELDLPEVLLDRTYRVPSNIWDYAKSVIKHDTPNIRPDSEGGKVTAARGDPVGVVEYDEGSTMFLARTRGQLHKITESLKSEGVIFRSQDRLGGWNNATRRFGLYNALQKLNGTRPLDGINPNTGQSGIDSFGDDGIGIAGRPAHDIHLADDEASALVRFTPAEYFSTTKKAVSNTVGALNELTGEKLIEAADASFWEAMTKGAGSVDNLLSYDAKPTLRAALKRNDDPIGSLSSPEIPEVLTIHAAKGGEADTVALYDGIPPAVQDDVQHDRQAKRAESRVWYVAVTRAAENLLVFRDEYDYCSPYLPTIT